MAASRKSKLQDLFKIKTADKWGGQHLVARKSFSAGQMIFTEPPLITYPTFQNTVHNDKFFTCVSCYQIVDTNKTVTCNNCQWPCCSLLCTKDSSHRKLECGFLKRHNILPTPTAVKYLFLIKFIELKKKNKRTWEKIMSMKSVLINDCAKDNRQVCILAEEAKDFLEHECNITLSLVFIKKLINILRINCFVFKDVGIKASDSWRNYEGLYLACRLMSHSCAQNSECRRISGGVQSELGIYTVRDIKAGDVMAFSYSDEYISLGTHQRQESLFNIFRFTCGCDRCYSPSELDTFFSGVKCPSCRDGWLLPGLSYDKRYNCYSCCFPMTAEQVQCIEQVFKERLEFVDSFVSKKTRKKRLDALILSATTVYNLHPNHHLVMEATWKWFAHQNLNLSRLGAKERTSIFEKVIRRAKSALFIANTFGDVTARTKLEYLISSIYIRFYFRSSDYLTIGQFQGDERDRVDIIRKIVKHLGRGIANSDPFFYNPETDEMVSQMTKRYSVWNSILSSKASDGFIRAILLLLCIITCTVLFRRWCRY